MALTPLMNLNLPVVGPLGTLGPTWASNINTALTTIDSHDHTTGKGSKIPMSGITVDSDLDINTNNAINANSYRMQNLLTTLSGLNDKACISTVAGDLWFNNGAGTAVQITNGAGINLSSMGAIGGDYGTSTASVVYTTATTSFSFTSAPGVASDMIMGPIFIYESVAGGKYVKLSTPVGLAGNYNLVFPGSLPGSTMPVQLDSVGNISTGQIVTAQIADANVTNDKLAAGCVTLAKMANNSVGSNQIISQSIGNSQMAIDSVGTNELIDNSITVAKMKINSVGTNQIIDGSVTVAKLAAQAVGISSSCGVYSHSTGTEDDITNLKVTMSCFGRSLLMMLVQDGSTNNSILSTPSYGYIKFYADGNQVLYLWLSTDGVHDMPVYGLVAHVPAPTPKNIVFKVVAYANVSLEYAKLVVVEQ